MLKREMDGIILLDVVYMKEPVCSRGSNDLTSSEIRLDIIIMKSEFLATSSDARATDRKSLIFSSFGIMIAFSFLDFSFLGMSQAGVTVFSSSIIYGSRVCSDLKIAAKSN